MKQTYASNQIKNKKGLTAIDKYSLNYYKKKSISNIKGYTEKADDNKWIQDFNR